MNYIELLNADLIKGYSKSDLEMLIGLPKNSLSGVVKGDKKLSKISQLKIQEWEASKKPSPLQVVEAKRQQALVKLKMITPANTNSRYIDIKEQLQERDNQFTNAARGRDTNGTNNDESIAQYEEELSRLGTGELAKMRRKWLTNKINELKKK